jgi:predicted Zn-dependent peptidase
VVDSAAVPDSVAPPPAPDTAMWIAVGQRSRSTVVAATITYPVGSANDDEGRGGTAWLLARTWQAMLTDALGPDASATVSVDRSRFRATVVATPDRWETAYETLVTVLNHRDVAPDHLEVARARLLGRMTFEAGAPVREFEIEAARLYADGHTDWARSLDGSPESLQAISVRDLENFRRTHLTGEYAAVAVSGAVGVENAVRTAAVLRRGTARRSNPRPATSSPQAWLTRDRRVEARDISNAAVAFAYPLPAHHDRTEAEFLAHVLQESLNSDPPDPSVYRVEASVTDAPGGPLVIIEATVFPDAGHRWEVLIEDAVRAVRSTNPNEDVYFPWRQRRFRSVSMNAEASPEALNSRLNEDLLRDGRQRDLKERIAALSAKGLVDLANALGSPHVLYFGPDLADRQ